MPHSEFAPAKVNLALHVLGRRADGYHELDSIVAFADIGDRLTFTQADDWALAIRGPFAKGLSAGEDNLVLQAGRAFERAFPGKSRPWCITLEKNLPVASGIGGGSADAAATLRALARLAGVNDPEKLAQIGRSLGADVPVCLAGKTCRMRGTGERIELLADVPPLPAVLVHPGIALATADVFAALALQPGARAFARLPDDADLAAGRNDLTGPALFLAPVIGDVLSALEAQPGLRFARMSGSGATCFGIFSSADSAAVRNLSDLHPQWWVVSTTLG